jgi:hypothetical protein
MSLTLELDCLVLGDGSINIFGVEIKDNKKVSDLKEAIKDKKKHAFEHVDADELEVYHVSFPLDDAKLKRFHPEHEEDRRLSNSVKPLKGIFGVPTVQPQQMNPCRPRTSYSGYTELILWKVYFSLYMYYLIIIPHGYQCLSL